MLRYGSSLGVAALLIVAGFLYVRQVDRSVEQRIRQELRAAKATGKLPPGIDPETANFSDVGLALSPSEMRRIMLAHLLVAWRFVLIPLVVLGCLAMARILRRSSP